MFKCAKCHRKKVEMFNLLGSLTISFSYKQASHNIAQYGTLLTECISFDVTRLHQGLAQLVAK